MRYLMCLFFLVGCDTGKDYVCPQIKDFRYKDTVEVVGGFYEGYSGVVVGENADIAFPSGNYSCADSTYLVTLSDSSRVEVLSRFLELERK